MKAIVAAVAALMFTAALGAQHVRTLESARLLRDLTPVSVRLMLGTGTLSVGASDAPYLYRSITRFGDSFTSPTSTWNAAQHTLTLAAGQKRGGPDQRTDDTPDDDGVQDWRVQLTRRAPLELTIDATAADATLDLTGLPLRRFALNTGAAAATVRFDAPNPESMSVFDANVGAGGLKLIGLGNAGASEARIQGDIGDLSLDLGGRWLRDMQILVSTAIGDVRITAPPSIGIELQSTGLLARESFDGPFAKSNGVWRSANFSTAAVKVRIVVKSMIGKIELVQR
ncbi:MAG: hypothetical protein H7099_01675 [Gemmatimonadaceae bacterium]|nr:hypothetical protein [Gemmatimonadaceae bacterium]